MNIKELYDYAYSLLRYAEIDEEYDRSYMPNCVAPSGPPLQKIPLKIVGMALASRWAVDEVVEPLGVTYAGHTKNGPVYIGRYVARYQEKQEQTKCEQEQADGGIGRQC